METSDFQVNTLIIGSGAAALNAAICLYEAGQKDILIATEQWGGGTSNNAGSDKQTYYKLSTDPGIPDSAKEMAADLSSGGAMHGDIALIEAQYSLQAFYHLVRLGVPFPHDQYGAYPGYKTDHDPKARATSAGPLTSHLMFECLARKVKEYQIPIHDGVVIIELLTQNTPEGKAIAGAVGIKEHDTDGLSSGEIRYHAQQVILATGGPAGIYRDSVYPESQTGSIGLALKIGAKAQNLSISQYGIASVKFRWNLSGSYQQVIPRYFSADPTTGQTNEFLQQAFPSPESLFNAVFLKGYQWPFDPKKVANHGSSLIDVLVHREIAEGRKVYLDYTRNLLGFNINDIGQTAREYLEKSGAIGETPIERLRLLNQPAIDLYRAHGIDLTREPLEIAVCAQHNNGGLTGDIWWESNIRGLYPIGEVNGSHGLTRPGGSALNAGQVGGIRASFHITHTPHPTPHTPHPTPHPSQPISDTIDLSSALTAIQDRMSNHAGPIRDRETIGQQVKEAWDLWRKLNKLPEPKSPISRIAYYRTLDLCLTHAVYLESIDEHLKHADNEVFIKNNILEVQLDDDLNLQKNWIPVRPIPSNELWFEAVWKEYLNNNKQKPSVDEPK
ncbi:MAG: FAD-binding protein [Bacteroidales bacterium]